MISVGPIKGFGVLWCTSKSKTGHVDASTTINRHGARSVERQDPSLIAIPCCSRYRCVGIDGHIGILRNSDQLGFGRIRLIIEIGQARIDSNVVIND